MVGNPEANTDTTMVEKPFLPERYLVQRLVAQLIDALLLAIVGICALLALNLLSGEFTLSNWSIDLWPSDVPIELALSDPRLAQHLETARTLGYEIYLAELYREFFTVDQLYLSAREFGSEDESPDWVWSMEVNSALLPVPSRVWDELGWVLAAVLGLFFLVSRGATPGKILMRLRVADRQTGANPTVHQALIRYLPVYVFSLAYCVVWLTVWSFRSPRTVINEMTTDLTGDGIDWLNHYDNGVAFMGLVLLVLFVSTLIRWRGAVYYDNWAGTWVLSKNDFRGYPK